MKPSVIWITGASSGIGAALARQWAKEGAQLILSARSADKLEQINRDCGGNHLVLPLDMEAPETFANAVERAKAWKGYIDIAVQNAGISQRSRAEETHSDTLRRIMEINFMGAALLSAEQLKLFRAQKKGHFVVISSLSGKFGVPFRSGYCASKHALHGYFESVRAENASIPIHVTMVCPGFIHTDISVNALDGSGKPTGAMDDNQANGLPVERCSEIIVAATKKKKLEITVGGRETYGVLIKRFFPGILAKIMGKRTGH